MKAEIRRKVEKLERTGSTKLMAISYGDGYEVNGRPVSPEELDRLERAGHEVHRIELDAALRDV